MCPSAKAAVASGLPKGLPASMACVLALQYREAVDYGMPAVACPLRKWQRQVDLSDPVCPQQSCRESVAFALAREVHFESC